MQDKIFYDGGVVESYSTYLTLNPLTYGVWPIQKKSLVNPYLKLPDPMNKKTKNLLSLG